MDELIEFDIEKVASSIIMVVGVGGAGGNAVNHMYELGIKDVSFMVCNTDKQALDRSYIPIKVQMGAGLGAGNRPDKGREAAIDSLEHISDLLKSEGTKMIFVTAGMGGGTGTGAAPVIAKAAKDAGILTVGIVTMPYESEGPVRFKNAVEGIEEMKKCVDSLLIINNENIQEIYGELPITEAFGRANDILATAAKGIAEIITRPGIVNVDFADVTTVMMDSGVALMGSGRARGEHRAIRVSESALSSPLLNYNSVEGATNILFNITYGEKELTLAESKHILEYVQRQAGNRANVIWGAGKNELLGEDIELTIIATGFELSKDGAPISTTDTAKKRGKSWSSPFSIFGLSEGGEDGEEGVMKGFGADSIQRITLVNSERYANIDEMISTPAYIRREVKMGAESGAEIKVTLQTGRKKSEGEGDNNNSLF